ncbi:glutamate--cysteine ligase [Streptomyces sp. NPDC046727]|uniref:carboxylate-amine ligase n=1 Tax=Streptomyces sp. NPDC046727 TaxID=3155373 RepID=UPI0033D4A846
MDSEAEGVAGTEECLVRGRRRAAAAVPELLTVGVEEEYLLVDPLTREVTPQAHKVVTQASCLGLGDRVGPELTCCQVEARTDPHTAMGDLREQIRSMRSVVATAAKRHGLDIMSSGAPVLGPSAPPAISPGPRYAQSLATFRALDDEQTACACHVHVGLPDLTLALEVSNHLRAWIPALITLSGNSPYWAGRDTGYASWRTMVLARWPVAGPPPYFESPAHFEDVVGGVIETGAVMDRGGLYWDIRPSSHVPTLEVRVADAAAAADETVVLAALVRAMVATALKAIGAGESAPRPQPEILRAACWRAARDGLAGTAVDLPTSRLVPATTRVELLLDWVLPALERFGDLDLVRAGWSRLRSGGNGADRQRAAYRRRGHLADVVDHLVSCTTSAEHPGVGAPPNGRSEA